MHHHRTEAKISPVIGHDFSKYESKSTFILVQFEILMSPGSKLVRISSGGKLVKFFANAPVVF